MRFTKPLIFFGKITDCPTAGCFITGLLLFLGALTSKNARALLITGSFFILIALVLAFLKLPALLFMLFIHRKKRLFIPNRIAILCTSVTSAATCFLSFFLINN